MSVYTWLNGTQIYDKHVYKTAVVISSHIDEFFFYMGNIFGSLSQLHWWKQIQSHGFFRKMNPLKM
jgi:hypothetical protein